MFAAPSTAAAADNGDFVAQVYRDLLGRLPSAGELAVLDDLLDRGSPRGDIALLVVTSNEHRANFVQGLYGALLGRTASPGEISALITALAGGATDEEGGASLPRPSSRTTDNA